MGYYKGDKEKQMELCLFKDQIYIKENYNL